MSPIVYIIRHGQSLCNVNHGYLYRDLLLTNTGPEVHIWPDLREAHDSICNKGPSRAAISAKFPYLDFQNAQKNGIVMRHIVLRLPQYTLRRFEDL